MTNLPQPDRSSSRNTSKKKKPSLSTGGLKGLLIIGSAAATYFGANVIALGDQIGGETAVEPVTIIIQKPVIIDPLQPDDSPIIFNPEPIPQVIIPEPVTSSRSSR